jgi:hypothetical protein
MMTFRGQKIRGSAESDLRDQGDKVTIVRHLVTHVTHVTFITFVSACPICETLNKSSIPVCRRPLPEAKREVHCSAALYAQHLWETQNNSYFPPYL